TTRDPGASEDFTSGFARKPRSTAFFASKPAASITLGLLVFVQLVMAAINTLPCRISPPQISVDGVCAGEGVGRLFAISNSVCGLVFLASDSRRDTGS